MSVKPQSQSVFPLPLLATVWWYRAPSCQTLNASTPFHSEHVPAKTQRFHSLPHRTRVCHSTLPLPSTHSTIPLPFTHSTLPHKHSTLPLHSTLTLNPSTPFHTLNPSTPFHTNINPSTLFHTNTQPFHSIPHTQPFYSLPHKHSTLPHKHSTRHPHKHSTLPFGRPITTRPPRKQSRPVVSVWSVCCRRVTRGVGPFH